jgi:hypothetical protein
MKEVEFKNNKVVVILSILAAISFAILSTFFVKKIADRKLGKEKEKSGEEEKITPLMYEVTKEGSSNKIYLFGTIHVSDLKEDSYPDYVMNAYKDSDVVSPEFNILDVKEDMQKMTEYAQRMLLSDGTQLKDHLSEEVYNKLIELLKSKNAYSFTYEYMKPYAVESILANLLAKESGINGQIGVDEFFLKKAKEDGKEIIDVESLEFQLEVMDNISDEIFNIVFKESLDNYNQEVLGTKLMYQVWKQGDSNILSTVLISSDEKMAKYSDEEKELIKDYYYKTIDERNISMKNKLIELFNQNKKVFFMVGTAHIVGENGIARLLEKEGYTVTQVNK